jgi:hypothetical protein
MARTNTGSSSNYFGIALGRTVAAGAPQSVACWFRPNALATLSNLAFLADSGGSYFGVAYDGTNNYGNGAQKVVLDQGGANIQVGSSTTVSSTTVWQHACGTRGTTNDLTAYLNGGGKTTTNFGGTSNQLANTITIGAFDVGGGVFSPLKGDVAEVAFWDATLTDAEVLSLSKGVSPLLIRPDKLWFYSPLRNPTGLALNYLQKFQNSVTQNGTMTDAGSHPPMLDYRGAGLPIDFTSGGGGGTTTPQSVSITATTTTTATKAVGKAVAVTATSTSTFVKQAGKAIAATATSTTTFLKAVGKSIAATATTTTTAAAIKVILQSISITATSTTSVVKRVNKIAAITSTTSTALTRAVGKAVAATATSTTTILKQVGKPVSITATTTTTVGALKVFLQLVSITATSSVSMLRSVGKIILPIGTTTTTLGPKAITKGLAVVATTSTTATKQVAKAVALVATSTSAFVKAIGKALGIVSTTASTFGETFIPAGAVTNKTVAITATTSVTIGTTFIQGQADTHDGDLPADAWASKRWAEEAKRRKQLVERPTKLAKAAMRIPTQPINTPVTPLVASTSIAAWTPEDDDMDLADILDLL